LPSVALKKISVALEDGVYMQLIDYAAEKSKRMRSRLSVSGSASELISKSLGELPVYEERADVKR
jgi:hypothetical protein